MQNANCLVYLSYLSIGKVAFLRTITLSGRFAFCCWRNWNLPRPLWGKSVLYCFCFKDTFSRHRSGRWGLYFVSRERQSKQTALLRGTGKGLSLFITATWQKAPLFLYQAQKLLLSLVGDPWQGRRQETAVLSLLSLLQLTPFKISSTHPLISSSAFRSVLIRGRPVGRVADKR